MTGVWDFTTELGIVCVSWVPGAAEVEIVFEADAKVVVAQQSCKHDCSHGTVTTHRVTCPLDISPYEHMMLHPFHSIAHGMLIADF